MKNKNLQPRNKIKVPYEEKKHVSLRHAFT